MVYFKKRMTLCDTVKGPGMKPIVLNECLEVMKEAAREAGAAILAVYDTDFSVEHKADDSPLTLADRQANEIILPHLARAFPDVAVLSEESRDDRNRLKERYCFIVDPLDGTKEFVSRNGQFTVNIALVFDGTPVAGVIYVPVTGKLYYAAQGLGAYSKERPESEPRRLKVSDRLSDLIWVGSRSHSAEKEAALIDGHRSLIRDVQSAGSSLKGCLVAEGNADVYYRFGLTCEWDTAAMQCIAEEAGGIFRQTDGTPMTYNRENTLNEKGFYIVNRKENIWI